MSAVRVLAEYQRTSRGAVHCNSCGRTIAKGTIYTETHACDYRDIWTHRCCHPCWDAILAAWDGYDSDDIGTLGWLAEWARGMLNTHLSYHVGVFIESLAANDPPNVIAHFATQAWKELAVVETADLIYPITPATQPERVDAFIWRMRTSPALHPHGITD